MAGITHSAFRRLIADFGGYGALFTEMLSARALLQENLALSPFTRRRANEGAVIYQIRLGTNDPVEQAIERLKQVDPWGIDINLGCPAPEIKKIGAGTALFDNREILAPFLSRVRGCWNGPLTVKCRLGHHAEGWEDIFYDRLALFAECGIDAVTVHPRFSGDKLKRTARSELYRTITAALKIPVIANGDIVDPDAWFEGCGGIMIGRMAVVKPWIFKMDGAYPDYYEIWERFYRYVNDDFPPEKAIGRIREFTAYYSRNFFYGHELFRSAQGAKSLEGLHAKATAFLSKNPRPVAEPSVAGV